MKRIERLINLIAALLESERPLTAAEVREKIAGYDQDTHEAFRRAFERDKEHLRAMGIPLETVPSGLDVDDQPDAYTIPKDRYYLPALDLDADELAALRLASEVLSGAEHSLETSWLKLSVDAEGSPEAGPRARWGADVAAEQPHLAPLYGALLERRPVRFAYRSASGTEGTRSVEVYSLIHRRGNWYLVGRDTDKDAIRAYKLSRFVDGVEQVTGSYQIPDDFDASEHLKGEAYEIGDRAEVTRALVRIDAKMRWWAEQNMASAVMNVQDDGSLVLELPTSNVDALISWVLGFGTDAEILEPREARDAIRRHLSSLAGDPA